MKATCKPIGSQLFRLEPALCTVSGPSIWGGHKDLPGPLVLILEGLAGCFSVYLDEAFPHEEFNWTVKANGELTKKNGIINISLTVLTTDKALASLSAHVRDLAEKCPAVQTLGDRFVGVKVRSPLQD